MSKQIHPRAGAESGRPQPFGRTAGSIPATGATDTPLWPMFLGCALFVSGLWALLIAMLADAPADLVEFVGVLTGGGMVLIVVESVGILLDS